jgi:hypothetical protein
MHSTANPMKGLSTVNLCKFVLCGLVIHLMMIVNASLSFSAIDSKTSVLLYAKNNLGYEFKRGLSIKDGKIQVGNQQANLDEMVLDRDLIAQTAAILKVKRISPCAAGTYAHSVKIRGKEKIELGCIEEPHFQNLTTSFDLLERRLSAY